MITNAIVYHLFVQICARLICSSHHEVRICSHFQDDLVLLSAGGYSYLCAHSECAYFVVMNVTLDDVTCIPQVHVHVQVDGGSFAILPLFA